MDAQSSSPCVAHGEAIFRSSRTRVPGQVDIEEFTGTSDENAAKAGGIAAEQLKNFVERMERLREEKQALTDDEREVMAQARASGFDGKTLRTILKMRQMDPSLLEEQELLLAAYRRAIGM